MRAALLVLALATPLLGAPDVLDPAVPPTPVTKGERRRVVFSERLVQRLERTLATGPTQAMDSDERIEATWSLEVLEVADGRPAVVRVTFERWRRATGTGPGAREDASLEGKAAVVRRQTMGAELDPPGAEVSGAAKRFIERVADRLLRPVGVDEALRPPRPTSQGERWDALAGVGGLLPGAPHTEVVREGSRAAATLVRLEPGTVRLELEGEVRLANAPGTSDRFVEGGACALKLAASFPRGSRPSQGQVELAAEVAGTTKGRFPDGHEHTTVVRVRQELRWSETGL